jgi:hypothetical protein
MIKLKKGKKIELELIDSTKITGIYEGYKEIKKDGEEIKIINISDENKELKYINISEVNKYFYIDEGGNVF